MEIKTGLPIGCLLESYWEEISRKIQNNILAYFAILIIGFLTPLVIIIPESLLYYKSKKNFQKWSLLKKEGKVEKILEEIGNEKITYDSGVISLLMGIYVLADREIPQAEKEARNLVEILDDEILGQYSSDVEERSRRLLKTLKKQNIKQKGNKTKAITTTEVYFVSVEAIEQEKCMITGLPIDPTSHDITTCPYCGNFAKRELMEKWLTEKEHCPICKEKLIISDCPKVMLE
ncbi:MAG: hypothetical protein ACFFDW_01895 [Candidatus Thorarchaeota archaeon]